MTYFVKFRFHEVNLVTFFVTKANVTLLPIKTPVNKGFFFGNTGNKKNFLDTAKL